MTQQLSDELPRKERDGSLDFTLIHLMAQQRLRNERGFPSFC